MPTRQTADSPYRACQIERSVARAHPAVRARSCAVSTFHEGVIVSAEVTSTTDPLAVEQAIRLALAVDHGLHLHSLELTLPKLSVVA